MKANELKKILVRTFFNSVNCDKVFEEEHTYTFALWSLCASLVLLNNNRVKCYCCAAVILDMVGRVFKSELII